MTPEYVLQFDGGLAFLTLLGLFPTLWSFYKKESLNPLERRMALMTWIMASFFFFRGFLNLFHWRFLVGPVYTIAIFLIVATTLYFETLLRRHFPLWFKVFLTLGSVITIVLANTGHLSGHIEVLIGFGVFVFACQISIICFCLFRDRSQYTRIENSMIFTGVLALVLLAPLFMSDVTTFKLPLPKMGMLAALIFSYLSLSDQNLTKGIWYPLWNLIKSALASLLFILPFVVIIENQEFWFWSRFFMAVFGLGIAHRIFMAVKLLDLENESGVFLQTLNSADHSSVTKFLMGFRDFYSKVSIRIARQQDLQGYDVKGIEQFMDKHSLCLLSKDQIQVYLDGDSETTAQEKELLDQASTLLDTFEMTHLLKIGKSEVFYIFLCVPLVQYQKMVELQAEAISQTALLIQSRQKS